MTVGTDPSAAEPEPTPTTTTTPAEPTPNSPADPAETPPETQPEVLPGTVPGNPTTTVTHTLTPAQKAEPSPWRGSEIAYRNSASAISFDRAAELSYNPTWVMGLELSPRYNFSKMLSLAASMDFAREITNADDTTDRGEWVVSDLSLRLGVSNWATLPGDIKLSAGLGVTLPTSEASRGDTLYFSVSPSLRVAKTFDKVLDGLTVGYGLRFTKLFHQYTTGETAGPSINNCVRSAETSCDDLRNNGFRNASWRLSNGFDVSLGLTSWLTFSADFAVVVTWLYDAAEIEDANAPDVIEPTDNRYALVTDLGFSVRPWEPLEVRLGATTANPQLQPDGDYYAPFFNRYTFVYLDLRLDVAGLVSELTKED